MNISTDQEPVSPLESKFKEWFDLAHYTVQNKKGKKELCIDAHEPLSRQDSTINLLKDFLRPALKKSNSRLANWAYSQNYNLPVLNLNLTQLCEEYYRQGSIDLLDSPAVEWDHERIKYLLKDIAEDLTPILEKYFQAVGKRNLHWAEDVETAGGHWGVLGEIDGLFELVSPDYSKTEEVENEKAFFRYIPIVPEEYIHLGRGCPEIYTFRMSSDDEKKLGKMVEEYFHNLEHHGSEWLDFFKVDAGGN